ncbi:MAG: YceI family protein [Bacteriovorax sp.]|nr:YceI family protein [Bacteriovorax sp.]
MKKYLLLLFVLALAFSYTAHSKELEIVAEHSHIAFDVDYMLMTKVEGQFKKYTGLFEMNTPEDTLLNVRVAITGNSVDTNDGKRDFHLRGQEFFFVANYPEITFRAKGPVKIAANEKFKLPGEITLRGISKPLVLDGFYKGKTKDPWGKENYFFTLTGELNRKDFQMIWNQKMDNGGLLVGDIVRITMSIQSQVIGDKTPFSTHMVPSTKGIVERKELKEGKIKKLSTSTDPKDYPAKKEEPKK